MSGIILEHCAPGWLVAIGLLTGVVAALMGVGGGILLTPFLNIVGAPMVTAAPTAMCCIAASSTTTSARNWRSGLLHLKLALISALATMPAAEVATWVNLWLRQYDPATTDTAMRIAFAVAILFSIWTVSRPPRPGRGLHLPVPPFVTLGENHAVSLWLILVGAAVAGFVGAMLGIGGGLILVPLFVGVLGVDVRRAIATSSMVIVFTTWYAGVSFVIKGVVDISAAAWLAGGAITGAWLGATALRLCSGGHLKGAFVALNIAALLSLLLKQFNQQLPAFLLLLTTCIAIAVTALTLAWLGRHAHRDSGPGGEEPGPVSGDGRSGPSAALRDGG